MTPRLVEVFAEISCPFAHVSLHRLVEARSAAGATDVDVRVRAWPLELVNGKPLDPDFVAEEIDDLRAQVAADLFVGFDVAAFPASTILALGLATAAYDAGPEVGLAVNLAVRDALFEHGRPVADEAVLAEVAAAHGVALPDAATARARVEADWAAGREREVIGSPHFFLRDGSFFCPGLEIERRGEHLHIAVDEGPFREFLARAFPQ
jgi:predicted DsbA family dithiol-disulfide isomerase